MGSYQILNQRNWNLLHSIVVIFKDFAFLVGILCGKLGLQRICGDCRASRGFDPTCRTPGFPRMTKDLRTTDAGFCDAAVDWSVLNSNQLECFPPYCVPLWDVCFVC